MLRQSRDVAIQAAAIGLATGVIIGAAHGVIVSSLVDDALMPVIGLGAERIGSSLLFVVPNDPNSVALPALALARGAGMAALTIGLFINAVVKFGIVALVLFLVVKGTSAIGINKLRHRPLNYQL